MVEIEEKKAKIFSPTVYFLGTFPICLGFCSKGEIFEFKHADNTFFEYAFDNAELVQ